MMKLYKAFSIYLFAAIIPVVLLQSCKPAEPGFWKNDKIPSGKRDDFHDLNNQLFKAIKSGHPKEVELLFSAELLAQNYNTDKIAYYLKDGDYKLLNEYYIVHKYKDAQKIKVDSDYNLNYTPVDREMYIAFFLPKGGDEQYLITVVYGKYSYGWRVASLDVDRYTITGKTAPELYKQAKNDYDKGYFANAVTTMELASKCLRPSEVWQYRAESDMEDFYAKTMQTANERYRFPIVVKGVSTLPKIFRISNQSIPEGTYPSVYYLSKINLKDTTALKKENIAIRKAIEQVLPGITKNKKYILYSAFNEMPKAKQYVKSYDVTDRLQ